MTDNPWKEKPMTADEIREKYPHRHPHDHLYAEELLRLGKTCDCICAVDVDEVEYGQKLISLDYNLRCTEHFPSTSLVIGRSR